MKSDRFSTFFLIIIGIILIHCNSYSGDPQFGERIDRGKVELDNIDEASGIAASKKNKDVLWTHNDSGDNDRIFALNTNGRHLGVYVIDDVMSRDWEDIATGSGPLTGVNYLYIGDIGDNDEEYSTKYIYRVTEPEVSAQQEPIETILQNADIISIKYPDQKRDAETLLHDPLTNDLYIITKREDPVYIYRIPYPQSTVNTIEADLVGAVNLTMVVGGDISPDGTEILLKTYDSIYYWGRSPDLSIAETLQQEPIRVTYIAEVQGEAVCWDAAGGGYYTLSEELFGIPAHLYYYPRIQTSTKQTRSGEPGTFTLGQNYPNPFNPSTTIEFHLPEPEHVELAIFSVNGRLLETVCSRIFDPGYHKLQWNATTQPTGLYLYRLTTSSLTYWKKMMLVK